MIGGGPRGVGNITVLYRKRLSSQTARTRDGKQRYVVYGPWLSGWVVRVTWKCDRQTAVRKLVTIGEDAAAGHRVSGTWSMRDEGLEGRKLTSVQLVFTRI
jgi:hypothetical protein